MNEQTTDATAIREALEKAEQRLVELRQQEREARDQREAVAREIDQLRLSLAQAEPHPWLGKKVKRLMRHGFGAKCIERVGTVAIYDGATHRRLLGGYDYYCKTGNLIVLSLTGKSLWPFHVTPRLNETKWELAE